MAPQFFLRVGTHAETEPYVLRRGIHDGIIVNANLLEATSGATATMIASVHKRLDVDYFIDPYTHVFSLDPALLKSERKTTGEVKLKDTFGDLAARYGEPFVSAAGTRPLTPGDFTDDAVVRSVADSVIRYQHERIEERVHADDRLAELLEDWHPRPLYVLAPYFLTGRPGDPDWLEVNVRLVDAAAEPARQLRHSAAGAVLCLDRRVFADAPRLANVIERYSKVSASGYFLWISDLTEEAATSVELRGLRTLVESLAGTNRPVCNLHAGYFSMALSTVGLAAYSHGVGYGERRNVEPATGFGLPPERYYVPLLHSRRKQGEVEDIVKRFPITTVEQFHETICECPVCAVVVKDSVGDLAAFFELGPVKVGKDGRARRYPTPESIQRCRYHYLLNRRRERTWLATASVGEVRRELDLAADRMGEARVRGEGLWDHLRKWSQALGAE